MEVSIEEGKGERKESREKRARGDHFMEESKKMSFQKADEQSYEGLTFSKQFKEIHSKCLHVYLS